MTITLYTADGQEGNLGSDNATVIEDSSAGPGVTFVGDVLDTAVSWFTTSDGDPDDRRPRPGPQPRRRLRPHRQGPCRRRGAGGRVIEDALNFVYQNVTVPAGGTVAYLSFEAMRSERRRGR